MGLMDFIEGAYNQAKGKRDDIRAEAESMSIEQICSRLKNCHEVIKTTGYMGVLIEKAEELSDWELKELYKEQYRIKNVYAVQALRSVLEERGSL